ncbi:MAG: hypothetical protein KKA42_14260, partial [candidate division Zixibacteria bacterium]|nr:hypothetical protein [candidate division Zixibacteria bacterium]
TDLATMNNVPAVYSLLEDLGLRTTKSVWPLPGTEPTQTEGATCDDPDYLRWVLELQTRGFEIGYHMATYHTSVRNRTIEGLDRFSELFGFRPKVMANHSQCRENVYWGDARLSGWNRVAYNALTRFRYRDRYRGHVDGDPHFWGDLCREQITYCRGFVFPDINTLAACPQMPYHDPERPYVNQWYASSEGPEVNAFNRCCSEANQDRLEAEGGACIMYTHFGSGFYENGEINPRFRELITRLSRKNGWFVPVGTLLDYLRTKNSDRDITRRERNRLERRWLQHKMKVGSS